MLVKTAESTIIPTQLWPLGRAYTTMNRATHLSDIIQIVSDCIISTGLDFIIRTRGALADTVISTTRLLDLFKRLEKEADESRITVAVGEHNTVPTRRR